MIRNFSLSILSATLLILSFPPFDCPVLIWFALIPFFILLENKGPRAAFGWGYLTGALFFFGTLWWFIHVTLPGMILINAYLALYFGIFAAAAVFFGRLSLNWKMLVLPGLWVAVEYVRAHFLSGFGWLALGHSQYRDLLLIQIADVTGVAGLSFLIVLVNVLGREWFRKKRRPLNGPTAVTALLLIGVAGYGAWRLSPVEHLPQTKVSVVQGNISLADKWSPDEWPGIMEKYIDLTRRAALDGPELIIWTETAFPGFIWQTPEFMHDLLQLQSQIRTSLIFGLVTRNEGKYFNSALMVDAAGERLTQYDKLHLVPFGEYIPLRNVLPFLSNLVPIDDFTAGKEYTLFPVPARNGTVFEGKLAVLICFEDTIPELSREFVRRGAQVLVNVTNDAWFRDTAAPLMHLQAAIFRTVENHRSLIRSANTGLSCFIDPTGVIRGCFQDERGKKTFVAGTAAAQVPLSSRTTFYTKYGDVFTYLCFGCILMGILRMKRAQGARSA